MPEILREYTCAPIDSTFCVSMSDNPFPPGNEAGIYPLVLPLVDATHLLMVNNFQASAQMFLSQIENLDKILKPKRVAPIWHTKYAMLGLLRVQEHFPHYGHITNIYEGRNEDEGLIKTLPSLSPNSIKDNWQYNHLCAF
jgi:hypothetical protein